MARRGRRSVASRARGIAARGEREIRARDLASRWPAAVGVVRWIVVDHLVATLGLYGATLAIAFLAGVFPLLSIELFLVGAAAWGVAVDELAVLIAIAAVGHQVAKTITYYAGAGAFELPRGRLQRPDRRGEAADRPLEPPPQADHVRRRGASACRRCTCSGSSRARC